MIANLLYHDCDALRSSERRRHTRIALSRKAVLLARVVLHERLSWRQWAGVVCAMIAVMAIVR